MGKVGNRELDKNRLNKLIKIIILFISGISALIAIWYGKLLGIITEENLLYRRWDKLCSAQTGSTTWCWEAGFKDINGSIKLFWAFLGIAVLLPLLFFGGTLLLKYLYPTKNKVN